MNRSDLEEVERFVTYIELIVRQVSASGQGREPWPVI